MNQADDERVMDDAAVDQHDAQTDDAQGEMPEQSQDGEAQDSDEAEVVITLGDESPPSDEEAKQAAPEWVKQLRKDARELARKNRELEAKLAESAAPKQVEAIQKPTLADCDFDEEVFVEKLTAWHKQQDEARAAERAKAEQEQRAQQEWQAKRQAYDAAKSSLKVAGFEDAEETVKASMSDLQRAIMLDAVESPDMQAKLTYALGNNPAELKRLSSIANPIKFAVAVASLEGKLKVTQPKKAPPAERTLAGRATAVGVDAKLAQLEAEAERTGNRTEVAKYKKSLKLG